MNTNMNTNMDTNMDTCWESVLSDLLVYDLKFYPLVNNFFMFL